MHSGEVEKRQARLNEPVGRSLMLQDGSTIDVSELLDKAHEYANAAVAVNTVKAYTSDWRGFEKFCKQAAFQAMPAEPATVVLYLTAMAESGRKVSTIRRHAAAIARAHREKQQPNPLWNNNVTLVLEGIARKRGSAPTKKLALLRDPFLQVIAAIDTETESEATAGLRDRALLLLGFSLGLRRSEIVAIRVQDLSPHQEGMIVRLERSKTDQTGKGHEFLLPYATGENPCPVRAIRAWIDHAEIESGPIARRLLRNNKIGDKLSAQSIALIVKRRAEAAGLKPEDFAGHSLRSGYATQAARDGHRPEQIADVTRHRDRRSLDGYTRAGKTRDEIANVL